MDYLLDDLADYTLEKEAAGYSDANYYDNEIEKAKKHQNISRGVALGGIPVGGFGRAAHESGKHGLGNTLGIVGDTMFIGGLIGSHVNNKKIKRLKEEQFETLRRERYLNSMKPAEEKTAMLEDLIGYTMEKEASYDRYDRYDPYDPYQREAEDARKKRNTSRAIAVGSIPVGALSGAAHGSGNYTLGTALGMTSNAMLIGGLVGSRVNNNKMKRLKEEQYYELMRDHAMERRRARDQDQAQAQRD